MCVYKMHTVASCLEFETKKNTNIFFALYDWKLMIFWRKRDIHYGQNCAVGSGAPCCLTHVKMFIFWRKEWKANKLKKMVILIDEKKEKKYETRGNGADFVDFL